MYECIKSISTEFANKIGHWNKKLNILLQLCVTTNKKNKRIIRFVRTAVFLKNKGSL